jgi:hypothetical protein
VATSTAARKEAISRTRFGVVKVKNILDGRFFILAPKAKMILTHYRFGELNAFAKQRFFALKAK